LRGTAGGAALAAGRAAKLSLRGATRGAKLGAAFAARSAARRSAELRAAAFTTGGSTELRGTALAHRCSTRWATELRLTARCASRGTTIARGSTLSTTRRATELLGLTSGRATELLLLLLRLPVHGRASGLHIGLDGCNVRLWKWHTCVVRAPRACVCACGRKGRRASKSDDPSKGRQNKK
jgi:hypothetical protein